MVYEAVDDEILFLLGHPSNLLYLSFEVIHHKLSLNDRYVASNKVVALVLVN